MVQQHVPVVAEVVIVLAANHGNDAPERTQRGDEVESDGQRGKHAVNTLFVIVYMVPGGGLEPPQPFRVCGF